MPENILIFQSTDTKLSTQNSYGDILIEQNSMHYNA